MAEDTVRPSEFIRVTPGRVARITLARAPLNVLHMPMLAELYRALREIVIGEPAVLVLDAEGRAFSAGVDVADHTADRVGGMLELFHSVFRAMEAVEAPIIARVHGAALGGGCELVAACDLVVASASATFGQPEIKVGVFPPVAAIELPRLVGPRRAAEMLLAGEALSAEEARTAGLVNRVFPDADFDAGAEEFIGRVAQHGRLVLAFSKAALRASRGRSLEEALPDLEVLYLDKLMRTQDAREGIAAFLEKRPPRFTDS